MGEGTYANLAIVSHSLSEFILDFVRVMPNMPKAKVKSRIVLTPEHAKGLMQALQQQVQKYEEEYGPIRDGNPSRPHFHPFLSISVMAARRKSLQNNNGRRESKLFSDSRLPFHFISLLLSHLQKKVRPSISPTPYRGVWPDWCCDNVCRRRPPRQSMRV